MHLTNARHTPGSFLEFLPIVDTLTRPTTLKSGRSVSFDVVIPSLPGFAFSAPPPPVWTLNDTARIWNTLMADVLEYTSGYSVAGTDWVRVLFFTAPRRIYSLPQGALINWCLLNDYPLAKAAHFNFLAIVPPSPDALASTGAPLSDFERSGLASAGLFFQTGTAYFTVHQTRVSILPISVLFTHHNGNTPPALDAGTGDGRQSHRTACLDRREISRL